MIQDTDSEHNPDLDSLGTLGIHARKVIGDAYFFAFKLPMLLQQLRDSPTLLATDDFVRRDLREAYGDARARVLVEHAMRDGRIFPLDGWGAIFAPEPIPPREVVRDVVTHAVPRETLGTERSDRWRAHLLLDSHGHPRDVLGNYRQILAYHPQWAGTWRWDTFRDQAMCKEEAVSEDFFTQVAEWLMIELRMPANKTQLLRATVQSLARERPVDPLIASLDALAPWDGIPRVATWLTTYAGAEEGDYAAFVGTQLLCGMLARALEPGCIMRSVVILEGAENTGKSTLVAALGHPWSSHLFLGMDQKESQMRLRGVWVMELPELDAMSRAEETRIKAFISATTDAYIPKYSNDTVQYARRTVFVGTTNEAFYLKGLGGNTRFLPIATHEIDVPGFVAVRDQLFQEARHIITTQPRWWEPDDGVLPVIHEQREARRTVNEYEDALRDWLEGAYITEVGWPTIAKDFLRLDSPEHWKDKGLQQQIGQALRAIGWERKTVKREGRAVKHWFAPVPF